MRKFTSARDENSIRCKELQDDYTEYSMLLIIIFWYIRLSLNSRKLLWSEFYIIMLLWSEFLNFTCV